MNTKNLLVSFLAIVCVLSLAASVSAVTDAKFTVNSVRIDDVLANNAIVNAGDKITVEVRFTSNVDARDVTVTAEFGDAEAETSRFIVKATDVNETNVYKKTLTLTVPSDFDNDEVEYIEDLEVTIEGEVNQEYHEDDGRDFDKEVTADVTVLKQSYNAVVKSIVVPQSIDAGETFPVDIVLKNDGYFNLDDLYVVVSIPALELEQAGYFGDLVDAFTEDESHHDDDDTDTVNGRLFLEVPYGVEAGIYTLEVTVENDDTTTSVARQIAIDNDFETNVFVSGSDLWIVNPTNNVVGYRVVPESPASVSESIVFVPAGSSKTISIVSNAEGEYAFDVSVFTMTGDLVQTVSFSGAEGTDSTTITNPVVVLTVILAIIFLVLLIVLIVLIGKKPEKAEEFGESYY